MATMHDDAFIEQFFMDSDSDEEFLGFDREEIERERQVRGLGRGDQRQESDSSDDDSDGDFELPFVYEHPWMQDFNGAVGPHNVPNDISEVGLFQLFITDDMLNLFVTETNRYADQVSAREGDNAGPHSRVKLWKPVTFDEMKAFIAVLLLLGLNKRSSYDLYWSTDCYLVNFKVDCTPQLHQQ